MTNNAVWISNMNSKSGKTSASWVMSAIGMTLYCQCPVLCSALLCGGAPDPVTELTELHHSHSYSCYTTVNVSFSLSPSHLVSIPY